ncbi:MAG: indole-3-glycerol phosphate synthase TrpC [Candidatus Zixiibacteriota bacterium]
MLSTIAESVRSQLSLRSYEGWEREIEALLKLRAGGIGFRKALKRGRENFILEIKRTSPSNHGVVHSVDVHATAACFQRCGAAAVSVLTEGQYFGGSLADLATARESVTLPLLRKDFIVDKLQIAEAKAYGADAVLLITAILSDHELRTFIEFAASIQIDALVEVHSEAELARAVDAGAGIIGVNSRDLHTMKVDLSSAAQLLRQVPDHCVRIAESGLKLRSDIVMMRDAGADAFLVGSSVMHADNMTEKIAELMGV